MRLLVMLCAGLLIVNVAVFLWPMDNQMASHVYAQRADVNPHFLSLNKEVEAKHYQSSDSIVAANGGTIDAVNGDSCYRLGPFMHQANYELAQAVLFNAKINYKSSKRISQQSLVFRVYLGPFVNQAEIDDARVDLKRKKVLDHFVRKDESGSYIISLGIYTSDESANKAVALFEGKLDSVKLKQEELVLPESYWLHFALNEEQSIRQQLAAMDWGELAVKLGKYECLEG